LEHLYAILEQDNAGGEIRAPVAESIDFNGRDIDPVLNDAETGIWGLGAGWEMGLIALDAYLKGRFPADPEAAEMNPHLIEAANRISTAWSEAVTVSKR
jgi:hypothetical protein